MNVIKRNAIVPYTPKQMYELVDNIAAYPLFLQWCSRSEVLERSATEVTATLEISWKGMSKSFTTRNHLHPNDRIEIDLVDGPLKHLEGKWRFTSLGDEACKVELDLEFELAGSFIDRFIEPIFNHIANTFVDAFTKRAEEVYGKQQNNS